MFVRYTRFSPSAVAPRIWHKITSKNKKDHLAHSELAQISSKKKYRTWLTPTLLSNKKKPGTDTKQKNNKASGAPRPGSDTKQKKKREHLAHSDLAQITLKKKETTRPKKKTINQNWGEPADGEKSIVLV